MFNTVCKFEINKYILYLDVRSSLSGKRRGIWYLLKSLNQEYKFMSSSVVRANYMDLLLAFFEKHQPIFDQTKTTNGVQVGECDILVLKIDVQKIKQDGAF